jgi:hypothetical protein
MRRDMEWSLGLSAWIIQDGNYGDIGRGDLLEAAVEFHFEGAPTPGHGDAPQARHLADSVSRHLADAVYDVVGRVLVVESDVWAIDIGIGAFCKGPLPGG